MSVIRVIIEYNKLIKRTGNLVFNNDIWNALVNAGD